MKEKQRYFVCGGGHQGLAMAAYLALNGEKVTLWNRTLEHIEEIKKNRIINCTGVVRGAGIIEKASEKLKKLFRLYFGNCSKHCIYRYSKRNCTLC